MADKSVTKCGKVLNMHKNTVSAHIEKIRDITDNNLFDPSDTFHMLLSFELMRYSAS
jgi:DNA-binding PucR family transcriptional regulator